MRHALAVSATIVLVGILAVVSVIGGTFYVVPVNEHSVVTRFGKIVRVHSTPGVHVKVPFLDTAHSYPKWILEHDSDPVETVLGDKRNVIFDTFLLYKIDDPRTFHTRIRNEETLVRRIDDVIFGAIRVVAGLYAYEDILNNKRDEILRMTEDRVRDRTKDMGIEVVRVAIRNFTLPDQNIQAIYSNMKSERVRIAQGILAAGRAESDRITASADRRAQEIIASAYKQGQTLRGEGDKQAQVIISDAMGQSFALYEQMKAVEFFRKGLRKDSVLVVDPGKGLLRYLTQDGAATANSGK